MPEKFLIPVILGTSRPGNRSRIVADFVVAQATAFGFDAPLVRVQDFVTTPITGAAMTDEKSKEWSELMTRAEGLIIVMPEYNHGYPGELKLFLDEVDDVYEKKPLGICGVSAGGLGGARAVEVLRTAALEFKMIPLPKAVYFSSVKSLFDENGTITDVSYEKRLASFLEQMAEYLTMLRSKEYV